MRLYCFGYLNTAKQNWLSLRTGGGIRCSNIYALLGIIVLSLLAAFRSPEVGADVKTYILYVFERVTTYDSVFDLFNNHFVEVGYELLCYFTSLFTNDIHVLHFVTSFIIIGCIYSFAKNVGSDNSLTLSMFVFICFYYNQTLSAVRQWLAIAIYLYGCKYLVNKHIVKYFLFCFIAYLFHDSAIICFPIYFLYWYINERRYSKNRRLIEIIIVSVILVLNFDNICWWLINNGILPTKYIHYLTTIDEGQSSVLMQIGQRFPLIFGALLFKKQVDNFDNRNNTILSLMFIDLFVSMLSNSFGYAIRISMYFGTWQIMYMSEVYESIKKSLKKGNRFLFTFVVYALLFIYWYYTRIYRGFSGTYPYASDVLNIILNNCIL